MADTIRVKGSKGSLQDNMDFYLQITSTGYMRVEELRKEFFREFMKEEKERMLEVLEYSRGTDTGINSDDIDDDIWNDEESEPSIDEDNIGSGASLFMQMVQGVKSSGVSGQNDIETEQVGYENGQVECQEEYDNCNSSDDEVVYENDEVDTQEEYKDFDYSDSSIDEVYYEGEEKYNSLPEEDSIQSGSDEPEEYESHGVYIEEFEGYSDETSDNVEAVGEYVDVYEDTGMSESADTLGNEESEYSEHGVFLEDIDSVDSSIDEVSDVEDGSYSDEIVEYTEYEEGTGSEECYDEGVSDGSDTNDLFEDYHDSSGDEDVLDEEVDSTDYISSREDNIDWLDEEDEEFEDKEPDLYDEDNIDWLDEGTSNTEEVLEESQGTTEEENLFDNSFVESESQEEKIEVPSDIRQFLRKHPMSTIDFVLQYYSKKDVDKALALGRIYKRKGKLMI